MRVKNNSKKMMSRILKDWLNKDKMRNKRKKYQKRKKRAIKYKEKK